ncbi:ABC transporter ATP-binding protein [Castellaniella sp.]|uniref:ABC transporter ATP-binding protein n=1 Tax=Castellaniella sp. TaxID=1955812 RepID=UPI003560D6B8
MPHLLEVQGLHVDIDTDQGTLKPIVGIDLVLDRGETLAIVGESGCGKSLTAHAILGLLPRRARLRAERLSYAGRSLLGLKQRAMNNIRGDRICMIFQDPMTALDPCYTVGAQMVEVLRQHATISAAAARARALELLDLVQVAPARERFGQYPHELSGGLRQRVMIAMSLLCEPDLLIADEPTTALDVTVQAQILQLLMDIQHETGIGMILITHDLGVVARVAHRTAVMYCGQIVEHGPTRDLLDHPLHPYTEGLLRSIPIPGRVPRRAKLGYIPGIVPAPLGVHGQCTFAPRCPYATEPCWTQAIALRAAGPARDVRCILPLDGSALSPEIWNRALEEET